MLNAPTTVSEVVPREDVEESIIDFDGVEFQPLFSLDQVVHCFLSLIVLQFEVQKVIVDTNALSNSELIKELEKRGLSTKGTKLDKIERLEKCLRQSNETVKEDAPVQIKHRQVKAKVKSTPAWMKKQTPLNAPKKTLPPGWR